MLENWNTDKTQIAARQEALKKQYEFTYVGHGPRATGMFSKEFKRKAGLFVRCTQCGYYMPLDAKGEETCTCGNLRRDARTFKSEVGASEVEVFKGSKRG
ncbi:MAG: hypothetical protein RR825_04970 [Ruthenibacterium sp.]